MRRIRSRLTYANVISTLALFLVLAGGTALASYVISSNSQVGPGTISGHHPPSGDHANIVGGSVNARDVANESLTRADLAPSALPKAKSKVRPLCNPDSFSFIRCGRVTINLARPSKVLVEVTGEWMVNGPKAQGECVLTQDYGEIGSNVHPGSTAPPAPGIYNAASLALSDVVGPLTGRHTLGVQCRDLVGDMDYSGMVVSAVVLGPA